MDSKSLRTRALNNVRINWGLAIGAAVIAYLLGGLGSSFIPKFEYSWTNDLTHTWNYAQNSRVTYSFNFGSIFSLVHFIIGGVIELGYCKFLLKQHNGLDPQFNDLFSEFDRFGNGFAQRFLRNLYSSLWALLFIIPGIIASYRYAMTPYIMAENPNLTASEAISRSKEMMDGHKADLFVLHLTFIGWDILAALTLNIGYLWLNPYKNAAEAVFYRELKAQQQEPTL